MSTTPMSGLANHLKQQLAQKPLLLMTHLVVGYPSLEANWAMLEAMDRAGVDLVELQLPFSEPIADGPRFVKANHDAIQAGTTWHTYFDFAAKAAQRFSFKIVFMGYYNSVFGMGAERFCASLSESGMSGFILPDLPPEEATQLNAIARGRDLDPILIMTPTSSPTRLAEIGRQASGFLYCAARVGVTGRRTDLSQDVVAFMEKCRAATSLPLGLGFGIRTPSDVRGLRGLADMAIVGTAGLDAWEERGAEGYLDFLQTLVGETV
ncbi:tryptophan synthase subunit alpha [Ralstonia solanacearum]|nr:tryptophan synthase subunit alpha [Ralstonia solanacearum]MBB6581451.1 tryptophan synthase subunit alpha [Ralstonia solanacearum]MDC6175820.1 tryptophan synthase subunit alpha [Ralstonia solanacearum]TYZ55675.1 tryptophan synthase subunit alpha [Ralstonia solanacearum]